MRRSLPLLALFVSAVAAAQTQAGLDANQQFAHDVYKQLIEFNTSNMTSGTTIAAQAMADRFRTAGFPDSDIFLGGVRPDKFNVVLRHHGKGGAGVQKPVLLLAHIDVVEALKADWSPDIDPFKFMERDGYYYGRGTSDDKAMFGDIPTVPTMGTGATDSQPFRVLGIPSYGVSGLMGDPEDIRSHGKDERMLVKSYYDGQEFLYRLTKALAGGKTVM